MNEQAIRSSKVYPEEIIQIERSSTSTSISLPILKKNIKKFSNREIYNMGIVRSHTIKTKEHELELECTHLVPLRHANTTIRKDRNGEQIDKRSKKHRITFKDEVIGGEIADVINVRSYKKYNGYSDDNVEKCYCKIF